ncbi:MAG: hypothetical protein GXP31_00980 [Kiritimatiellaeota bacterium]|nr:hypothetical protein [Kiritimatiellota bacterium]
MKTRRRTHPFTMIEIVLALGVIAIGVVSVLALFPVGIKAGTDAMATDYSAQVGDEMLHYLEQQIRIKTTSYDGWIDYLNNGAGTKIPEAGSTPAPNDFDVASATGHNQECTLYWNGTAPNIVYKVIRYVDKTGGTANQYDPGIDILDYSAIAVVWRKKVVIPGGPASGLDYSVAACLNVEISWPAQLPYGAREKRTYSLELFNR